MLTFKNMNDALGINESNPYLHAVWPAPANVHSLITTRLGGVSQAPYASLNLGLHVGDVKEDVLENRRRVANQIPVPVCYLNQVHGVNVIEAVDALNQVAEADAAIDTTGRVACAVMTADCLPVLLTNTAGTVVAAAHAGWRGLAAGILGSTVDKMQVSPMEIMAYLGPAIGPDAFEVGQDVYNAFALGILKNDDISACFMPIGNAHYLADIYQLARLIFKKIGVTMVYGGECCTVIDRQRFFSHRRDGTSGRMISTIWLD